MATLGRRKNRIKPLMTACLVLVLGGLFFHMVDRRAPGTASSLRGAMMTVAEPLLRAGSAVRNKSESVWLGLFSAEELQEENLRLREQLAELRLEHARDRSEAALAVLNQEVSTNIPQGALELVPAPVLSSPSAGGRQILWLARGREHGLLPGMVVLGTYGIVGVVEEVFGTSSRVVLLTDRQAHWGAEIDRRDERGLLRGTGDPTTVEFHFDRTAIQGETGDRVVSTGMAGSLAPGGVPFGTVREIVLNKKGEPVAIVDLPERPDRLRTVFVLPVVREPMELP